MQSFDEWSNAQQQQKQQSERRVLSFDEWSNEQKKKKLVNDSGALSFDEWSERQKAKQLGATVTAPILYPGKETLRAAQSNAAPAGNAMTEGAIERQTGNALSRRTHTADATQRIEQTKQKFYSMPELGQDTRWENQLNEAGTAAKEAKKTYEAALSRESEGRAAIEQASAALQQLQAQYRNNPSDLNAILLQNRTGNFYKLLNKYSDSYKDTLAYYDAYTKAYDRMLEANEAFHMYQTNQKQQYDAWKAGVRPEAEVKADIAALNAEIKQYENILTGLKVKRQEEQSGTYDREILENELKIKQIEEVKKKYEEELSWAHYFSYDDLRNRADFAELSQYQKDPRDGTEKYEKDWTGRPNEPWYSALYEAMNGNEEAQDALYAKAAYVPPVEQSLGAGMQSFYDASKKGKAETKFATPEQTQFFNYYYRKYGKEAAEKFYEERLRDDLMLQQREESERKWKEFATKNAGTAILATIGSVLESPMKGASYLMQLADYLEDGKIDENAAYNNFSRWNTATRDAIMEKMNRSGTWGKVGSFAYGVGTSMADFAWQTFLSGGFSSAGSAAAKRISEAVALGIMGTGAAADATIAAKDRGLTDDRAFALGTIAGAAEILTEKFSVEALLEGVGNKRVWQYILKNAFTEGTEEVGSDVINFFADVLIAKDKSQWEEAIRSYEADGKSEKQAFLFAVRDQALSMGESFLGGFLSGGTMAAVGSSGTAYSEQQLSRIGRQLGKIQGADADNVITALKYPEQSDIHALGLEYAKKLADGKKLTNLERGKLFAMLNQAVTPQADLSGKGLRELNRSLKTDLQNAAAAQKQGAQTQTQTQGNAASGTQTGITRPVSSRVLQNSRTVEITQEIEARLAKADTAFKRNSILAGASDEAIETAGRLSSAIGREIVFYNLPGDDSGTQNGFFDRSDGRIYVNTASANPLPQIVSHELTHSLEGSESYRALHSLVLNELSRQGQDLEALRQKTAQLYARNGVDLSMQTPEGISAVDTELVANYVEQHLLTDAESIQRVVRQNRTLGHRILRFINGLLGKIGFKSAKERSFLLRARSLYNAALNETQSSFRRELQQKYDAQNNSFDTVRERYENGELSEAEAAAEHDRLFDPELYMEQRSGDPAFSIEKTTDNRPFVQIDEDILQGVPKSEWGKVIRQTLAQKFPNGIPLWNNIIQINQGSRRELTMSGSSRILEKKMPSVLSDKYRAATHADELLHAATDWKSEQPNHARTDNLRYFSRGTVLLQIGGNQYSAEVVIGETEGHTLRLHDISNIQKTAFKKKEGLTSAIPPFQGNNREVLPSTDSIAQNQNTVNRENAGIEKWSVQHSISPRLEDDFISVVKGTFDKNSEVTIGTTSDFLTNTLGVQALPVTMPANKAYSAIVTEARAKADGRYRAGTNYHGLGVHGLALALEASEDPIAAFASKPNEKGKRTNSVVLVTKEIQRGKNIVVVEAVDTLGRQNGKQLNVNKIVTAYDRAAVLRDIVDASNDGRLLHLDKKRSQQILAGSNASNSRRTIQRINTDFSNSIANFRENVKWEKQGKQSFSAESPTATKTPMQLAMEQAQQKAEQGGRQNSYSPKTQEEKRDIVSAFRQYLNGEIDTETLRKRVGTDKIGTVPDGRGGTGSDLSRLSGTDLAAARLVQQAHRDGISVDEYLRQNAEHYTEEDGSYNKTAMTAIAMERKEAWRQWSLAGEQMSPETDEAAEQMPQGETDFRAALPKTVQTDLHRTETALLRGFGQALHITSNAQLQGLQSIVRTVGDEYFATGRIAPETADALFEQAWVQNPEKGRWYSGEEARLRKQSAKIDFDAAIADALPELRSAQQRAAELTKKAAERSTDRAMTYDEAKAAYRELSETHWQMEKTKAKNPLTEDERIQVGRLLRGEIRPEHLTPEMGNVKRITAVYEATQAHEAVAKRLDRYRRGLKEKLRADAAERLQDTGKWKDKKAGILYARETMERNIFDIAPNDKVAADIVRHYILPVHKAEAEATRMKNEFRDKVRALDINQKIAKGNAVSEAYAVQLIGEAESNIKYLEGLKRGAQAMRDGKTAEQWRGTIVALQEENPNMDFGKIRKAAQAFHELYDKLFEWMNRVRIENGYAPVNYREGYFPHFSETETDGVLTQFCRALGIDPNVQTLPTTINGLTHSFKPGITWFANANERLGFNTAYDAVQGFDKYIEGVANVIFQTENIQKLRALAQQIRYSASDKGIREQMDATWADTRLTEEEKQVKINALFKDGKYRLSNFVNEIDEYTNLLANKKSRYDRNMESFFGRRAYTVMKNFESRVGANMIAGNLTSAFTNFIPLTQAWGQIDSPTILKAMWKTLRAYRTHDGFAAQSDFLTNRRGSDPLVKTWAQKASGVLGTPMEFIDTFTADTIVRARYDQNMRRGLSEAEAMTEADAFAGRVMADRSRGSMPTLFGSTNPVFKAFTQFQLEVNNQFSEIFKDLPRAYKDKGLAALAAALLKYFFGVWLYNELYEFLIGRRPALDPIGMLNDATGDYTGYEVPNIFEMGVGALRGEKPSFRHEKAGFWKGTGNLAKDAAGQLPFASGAGVALGLLGVELDTGRIPVSAAVPDVAALVKAASAENWSGKKRWYEAQKELSKLAYVLPPFGGNQAQKAYKSIKALIKGGSYSMDADGNETLQYPVYTDSGLETAANAARMVAFGKNSLPTAQQWADGGYKALSAAQTAAYRQMQQAGATQRQSFELLMALRSAPGETDGAKAAAQAKILKASNVPDKVKAIAYGAMIPNATEREKIASLDPRINAWEVISGRIAITEAAQQRKLTEQDKWSIAVAHTKNKATRNEALRILMKDGEYKKLQLAQTYEIKAYCYVAIAKKLKEISPDGQYSSKEIMQAIGAVCGPLTLYPGVERDNLDFVKCNTPQRAALWQIFSSASTAKDNPYDVATGEKVLREKAALKAKTED